MSRQQLNKPVPSVFEQSARILEHIRDGFLAVDEAETVVHFNRQAERLLGVARSLVVGQPLFAVFPEAQNTLFAEKLGQARQQQQNTIVDTFFEVRGFKNWYRFTFTVEAGLVFVYFYQPSEHQWAEEALHKSQQFNRALLSAMPNVVMRLSDEGKFLDYILPDAHKTDLPFNNIIGQPLADVFPLEVVDQYRQLISVCLASGEKQEFEYSLPRATGVQSWRGCMVPGGKNEVLVVAHDISEEKRNAAEYELVLAAEREQRLIAETLAEVTLALTSQTSLKDVLDEVLRQTQRLVSYRTAHIMLLRGDKLHIAGWQGYRELGSEGLVSNLVQPLVEFPIDAEVIRRRQPLVIADTHREPRWVVQEQTAWVRSHMVLPISLGEVVLGILRLDANMANSFSQQDVIRLQPLTNAAAIAMENARLYDRAHQELAERRQVEKEIRRRNRELALLNQIIAASATSAEINQILQITCQGVAQTFDLPIVSATMLTDNGLHDDHVMAGIVAAYPSISHCRDDRSHFSIKNDPIFQYLLSHKMSLVIADVKTDPRLVGYSKGLCADNVVSALVLPLVVDGRVVGSLNLQATQPHQFSDQEVNLAWRVVDQVTGVLARVQLDQKHRRLSEAIEQSAESVIITDTKGLLLYVNPTFERVTGYNRAEVLGKSLKILSSGKQNSDFYRELWQAISSGKVWHGRFINKRKDGVLYTDDATISPVRSETGAIVSYVGVQRDVTRELQLEEQYRQAQKMEAVGLLAGGIAHDFNNLLTVINGFAEMIQFEIPPDNLHLQKLASRVRYSGTRAAALVRQLMAFSRREFVEPQVLNLNKVVTDISKMLERLIEENIVLKTEFSPDLWSVKVDAHQIEQIIVNLTVNARDAMPNGGLLTIETENKLLDDEYTAGHLGLLPGEYVLLAVSDTGIGMSAEVKEHLFEPFFTTKELGKGTGLGLATVFGIVKQYDGGIFVYSEPDRGATFKIYLPRVKERSDDAVEPETGDGIPRGSETVLVVEDEATVRDLAAYMLRRQGYSVLEAANGEDALRLAQKQTQKIDLLLTDTVMPKMNGTVLAEEFKRHFPATKILFTSGYTEKNMAQYNKTEPGVDFIPKPFSAAELARKVRLVLDN